MWKKRGPSSKRQGHQTDYLDKTGWSLHMFDLSVLWGKSLRELYLAMMTMGEGLNQKKKKKFSFKKTWQVM